MMFHPTNPWCVCDPGQSSRWVSQVTDSPHLSMINGCGETVKIRQSMFTAMSWCLDSTRPQWTSVHLLGTHSISCVSLPSQSVDRASFFFLHVYTHLKKSDVCLSFFFSKCWSGVSERQAVHHLCLILSLNIVCQTHLFNKAGGKHPSTFIHTLVFPIM